MKKISLAATDRHIERYIVRHLTKVLTAVGKCEPAQVALASRVKLDTESALASEYGGTLVALVELVTLLSLANQNDVAQPPHGDADRTLHVANAIKHAQHLIAAGVGRSALEIDPDTPTWQLGLIGRGREVFLRATVYDRMLAETLRILFNDEQANIRARTAVGFGGKDALDAIIVFKQLHTDRLQALARRYEYVQTRITSLLRASKDVLDPNLDEDFVKEAEGAVWDITEGLAQACSISYPEVAEASGVPYDTVHHILDAFTISLDGSPREMFERFIAGDDPFRTQPIIRRPDGTMVLIHESLAMSAIRERFEASIRSHKTLWEQYDKTRGQVAETIALDALESCLGDVECHRSLFYFVPDPKAEANQTRPDNYTKRVEVDGLILMDDVALIVEVKAVALTPESRSGPDRAVAGKLNSIVSRAAEQGFRLYDRIFEDGELKIGKGKKINLQRIREAYVITVSLEDLSGTLVSIDGLIDAGVVDQQRLPWTISLHDLKIVCALIEHPSQLLLYLRRRTDRAIMSQFLAMDEIDIFVLFLDGLFFKHGDVLHREMNDLWPKKSLHRFRRPRRPILYAIGSRTEPVDRWMEGLNVPGSFPAEPPRMEIDAFVRRTLDVLSELREFGWVSTAAALLEGSPSLQRQFALIGPALLEKLSKDHKDHYHGLVLNGSAGMKLVLLWYVSQHRFDRGKLMTIRRRLLRLSQEHGARSCSCLYIGATNGEVEALVYWPIED
ncbi:MAG TPA: hypothetical protein VNR65_00525 [Geobacterales bacterium]|nr:hypothetical protein [Geobacterales bacterium]